MRKGKTMSKPVDLEKQKRRLQSLLAKAFDEGSTAAERESAMTAAQAIMTKTGLTETSGAMGKSDAQGVADWYHPFVKTHNQEYLHPVYKLCGVTVMRFFGCDGYLTTDPSTGNQALRLLGTESDLEVARWLLGHLTDTLEDGWTAYKATRTNRNLKVLKEARITFVRAYCAQVNARIADWMTRAVPVEHKNALVVKSNAVAKRMESEGIVLGKAQRSTVSASIGAASVAGGLHGKGVTLGRGVGGTLQGALIGRD